MQVNQIMNLTKLYGFRKFNQTTTTQTQPILAPSNQPTVDTVSFKGNITTGINSSRKWIDYGNIFHEEVDLAGRNLRKAKTELVKLMNSNLSGANFAKSVFHCGNFTGANLANTNFENSALDGSWFKDVITNNTNFKTAYLNGAIFSGDFGAWTSLEKANVMGVDFKNANLENINFNGAIYDHYTEFPRGFNPNNEGMILFKEQGFDISNSTEFERMKLRYLNFYGTDFHGSKLKRADLKGCRFNDCNMSNCDLTRAYAKESEMVDCDLSDSQLKQLNLNKTYLRNVNMKNSNLRGAVLTWREAYNINLDDAIYDQYTVFNNGFNPISHGMKYVESTPAYYGIK